MAEHSEDLTGKSATSGSDGNIEVEKIIQQAVEDKSELLDLSSRALKTVPNTLGELTSLRSLNLSNNQLEVGCSVDYFIILVFHGFCFLLNPSLC